tara:strand:+ start:477 stop:1274 length:798 start_codon:yes stop_codon:yes gene_type:complete
MTEEQTLSMEPVVNTENAESVDDLSTEEKDSLLIGEDMERQQDTLLAGKYKDAKDLEQAYVELEKKLGEKSDPVSEEPESKTEPEEEEAPKDTEPNLLDQLWEEGTTNKLTKETFEKLSKMNPVEVAKMAMQQRSEAQKAPQSREFTDKDVQQIHGLVGGEENYNNMIGWANQNMPEQEVKMYDAVMDKGDPLAAYFAVQAMALRYQDKVGRDGQLVKGKAPKTTSDVFNSQQEMVKAMEDPRYNDDPAYREAILEKLERSNINF